MAKSNETERSDHEQRHHEVKRETANSQAENDVRMAQSDPAEVARGARERLANAEAGGRSVSETAPGQRSARPRPEVAGG